MWHTDKQQFVFTAYPDHLEFSRLPVRLCDAMVLLFPTSDLTQEREAVHGTTLNGNFRKHHSFHLVLKGGRVPIRSATENLSKMITTMALLRHQMPRWIAPSAHFSEVCTEASFFLLLFLLSPLPLPNLSPPLNVPFLFIPSCNTFLALLSIISRSHPHSPTWSFFVLLHHCALAIFGPFLFLLAVLSA